MKGVQFKPCEEPADYNIYDLQIKEDACDPYKSKFIFTCQATAWSIVDMVNLVPLIAEYDGPARYVELYIEKYRARVIVILDRLD